MKNLQQRIKINVNFKDSTCYFSIYGLTGSSFLLISTVSCSSTYKRKPGGKLVMQESWRRHYWLDTKGGFECHCLGKRKRKKKKKESSAGTDARHWRNLRGSAWLVSALTGTSGTTSWVLLPSAAYSCLSLSFFRRLKGKHISGGSDSSRCSSSRCSSSTWSLSYL